MRMHTKDKPIKVIHLGPLKVGKSDQQNVFSVYVDFTPLNRGRTSYANTTVTQTF